MVLLQGRAGLRELLGMNTSGWLVTIYSTLGMMAFIPSLQLTSVSNVAIIIATGPFLAAALAWVWLGEIPRRRTMATLPQMIFYGGMMRHDPAFRKQTCIRAWPAHAKMYDRAAGLPVGVAIGFAATIKGRRALKESIHGTITRWCVQQSLLNRRSEFSWSSAGTFTSPRCYTLTH